MIQLTQKPTEVILNTQLLPAGAVDSLYIHIPFCFHKCHYCDFYSITQQDDSRMIQFVDLILKEADLWLKSPVEIRPRTVFFGGGTPSLLPIAQMKRLMTGLQKRFDFSQIKEWTIEANPATVDLEYLGMLRESGCNRISFGAQSFDQRELKLLERHHEPVDVAHSVSLARQAGFRRLNLDLIFAIPGQSMESWMHSLDQALAFDTEHLSCYALTFEPNTPLSVRKRLGDVVPIDESLELQMLIQTRGKLAALGYTAYEISNFAREHEECAHNLVYWTGGDYIGLGPSAASHRAGHRWKNRPHLRLWEQAVDSGQLPVIDYEILSPRQRAGELAMLLLRLERGIEYTVYTAQTGLNARDVYREQIDQLTGLQLIEVDQTSIRLSHKGLAVADAIAQKFLFDD